MKRIAAWLGFVGLTVSCATIPPPPKSLGFDRKWSSNADGYVFSIGYFTDAEVKDARWEAVRREQRRTARFCATEKIVRRDVRWFPPTREGQPRCAAIIYSVACSPPKPNWGSSLEYEREQALLDEPYEPIPPMCRASAPERGLGQAPPSVRLSPRDLAKQAAVAEGVRCDTGRDRSDGTIRLDRVTRVFVQTSASPEFARLSSNWNPDYTGRFLSGTARQEGRVHIVLTKQRPANDANAVVLTQIFATNGSVGGYCVTLTARQGPNRWTRTIRRQEMSAMRGGEVDKFGHPFQPERFWTPRSDMHMLMDDLVVAIGLPLQHGRDSARAAIKQRDQLK